MEQLGLAHTGGKIVSPFWKTVSYKVIQTSNLWHSISTPIYSRNIKRYSQEDIYKNVHRKQPKCPSTRINKPTVVYSYTEILLSIKKGTQHWYTQQYEWPSKHQV